MKLCPVDFQCPYQATFDSLWEREGIDPGYCEMYYHEPNSKCPHPLSKAFQGLKIIRAVRFFGTDRVMVYGPDMIQLRPLQGKQYGEVKSDILRLSDDETKFCHHVTLDDPNQPVRKTEVSKEKW